MIFPAPILVFTWNLMPFSGFWPFHVTWIQSFALLSPSNSNLRLENSMIWDYLSVLGCSLDPWILPLLNWCVKTSLLCLVQIYLIISPPSQAIWRQSSGFCCLIFPSSTQNTVWHLVVTQLSAEGLIYRPVNLWHWRKFGFQRWWRYLACCPSIKTSSWSSSNSSPCLIIWARLVAVWSNIVLSSIDQIVPSACNCADMRKEKRFFLGEIEKAHALLPGSKLLEKVANWWWWESYLSMPCLKSLLVPCCSQALWLGSALLGGIPK